MQLSLDAADRLVELLQARRAPVPVEEATRALFALRQAPAALARSLLESVVADDARLAWLGARVALAADACHTTPIEQAEVVVLDLETTGLSPRRDRICEIGAVRVRGLALAETFETLVRPGAGLPPRVAALTRIAPGELRRAPEPELALRRFLRFAGEAPLAAHNARFDLAFLDRAVERLTGRRVAAPVIDTVWLARSLLRGRAERWSLQELARFFGTSATPCHRALPDALAAAEVLVALLGLAQERGARSLADVLELAAPPARALDGKRALAAGAPSAPGVYLFRDRHDQVLYVGKARDLRARLRSYFGSARQRPAVEAALRALARLEWYELGSELEAALEELRLIRELRPPANARALRPERRLYLARGPRGWAAVADPGPYGPLPGPRLAQLAARALAGFEGDDPRAALPGLRARLRRLAREQRFEEAARARDRLAALEEALRRAAELERLRAARLCLLAPAREQGFRRAFLLAGGRVTARAIPAGPAGRLALDAALAEACRALPSWAPEHAEELLVVGSFLRRPPPELRVLLLDPARILAA